jgi:hypothetical protein
VKDSCEHGNELSITAPYQQQAAYDFCKMESSVVLHENTPVCENLSGLGYTTAGMSKPLSGKLLHNPLNPQWLLHVPPV